MSAELKKHRELNVELGVAGRALPGLAISGDLHVVQSFEHGLLVAVIDGLGHGQEAALASQAAAAYLGSHAGEALPDLLSDCHRQLRGTRGAVVSIATFSAVTETMSWLAVGNVDGVLIRGYEGERLQRDCLPVRRGVVGFKMPTLHATTYPIFSGNTLIMATDGVASNFLDGVPLSNHCQAIADKILEKHAKATDDALVLVLRCIGAIA